MTRVLALDTTSAFGSIALVENDSLVEELPLHEPEGFSQTLFSHLKTLLDRHDWTIHSVDCFAAASGPGSFTGVRIGLTAVKGLAEATGKTAVAVSNLKALAACGSGTLRAVVIDARRGEVYGAVYDPDLQPVVEEAVLPFPNWIEKLPEHISAVISPDFSAFRSSFPSSVPVVEQRQIAAAIGRIASSLWRDGVRMDPAGIDANYVRRSDAELFWRDK